MPGRARSLLVGAGDEVREVGMQALLGIGRHAAGGGEPVEVGQAPGGSTNRCAEMGATGNTLNVFPCRDELP